MTISRQPTVSSRRDMLVANILLLVCLVPLLMPVGLSRGIGFEAIVTMLTGLAAWYVVWLERRTYRWSLTVIVATTYCLWCAINAATHPLTSDLFGTPLTRLGSLELLACIGIGLALRGVDTLRLQRWLYGGISALALVSLPYSLLNTRSLARLGGLLFQPDLLAVVCAVGIIIGNALWLRYRQYRWPLAILQTWLAVSILLTQTRAVMVLVFCAVLVQIWLWRSSWQRRMALTATLVIVTAVSILTLQTVTTNSRLIDASYASGSTSYRVALFDFAGRQLPHKPLFGYGPNGLQAALSCQRMTNPALLHTCHSGYYFDSSHNIFIDRFLALGWLGGVAFLLSVLMLLTTGLRFGLHGAEQALVLVAGMIALYFCTNVDSIMIELLFWICLLHAGLPHPPLTTKSTTVIHKANEKKSKR